MRAVLDRQPKANALKTVIRLFGSAFPEAYVVQIGANDGVTNDWLRSELLKRDWHAVLVEPVPRVFSRLAALYADQPDIVTCQAAIADSDGTKPFYLLREPAAGESVWEFYDALGSFRPEVLLSHEYYIPDIADRIVEITVPTMTFESLLAEQHLTKLDLLVLDVEGYDYEILRLVDFDVVRPQMVIYEHKHLSALDAEAASRRLSDAGYQLLTLSGDTVALHLADLGPPAQRLVRFFRRHSRKNL